MTFLWPMALLLLGPWAIACVRSARRGDARRTVPFVKLWPRSPAPGTTRRGRPPVWVMLILAGTLLTILAAAGPAGRSDAGGVTIIVDRHAAMTPTRLRQAFDRLNLPPGTAVRVIPVPGDAFDGFDASRTRPTALDTADQLQRAVRTTPGPASVLTDRKLDLPAGIIAIAPPPLANAGIDKFTVSSRENDPAGVALVRVFNGTTQTKAMLDVAGGRRAIDLPPAGQTRDYFFDIAPAGDTLTVRLLSADGSAWHDDVPGDDTAFLARTSDGVRLEPRTAVSEALGRFIAVYARHRPAGGATVEIRRGGVPGDRPAVILPTAISAGGQAATLDATHPLSRPLSPTRLTGVPTPSTPPGDGWQTLATAGDAVLLAVRETPGASTAARQVWVGFDVDALSDDPAYVVFWAGVFDWLAGGRSEWGCLTTDQVGENARALSQADKNLDHSPGLYQDGTDQPQATAMPAVRPAEISDDKPNDRIVPQISRRQTTTGGYFLLAGIGLIGAGLAAARLDRN
ncbi:MAG: hypothetical protein QM754_20740 [Tepidisphaeraceae bacterium]